MERVQKILANAGISSRRKCEELIKSGKVKVNGKIISIVDKASSKDKITVNGNLVKLEKKVYLVLNKPVGFVTTVSEKHGMKTIMSLVNSDERVYPVGRLDKDSSGLIILTNDGDLANRIMHPSYGLEKTYVVTLDDIFKKSNKLKKGVIIDGRSIAVKIIKVNNELVELKIHEGRKHIVRRIFDKLGYKVVKLSRTSIGNLNLGNLSLGSSRKITSDDLVDLRRMLKLS